MRYSDLHQIQATATGEMQSDLYHLIGHIPSFVSIKFPTISTLLKGDSCKSCTIICSLAKQTSLICLLMPLLSSSCNHDFV